jgi:hypothetical protein
LRTKEKWKICSRNLQRLQIWWVRSYEAATQNEPRTNNN